MADDVDREREVRIGFRIASDRRLLEAVLGRAASFGSSVRATYPASAVVDLRLLRKAVVQAGFGELDLDERAFLDLLALLGDTAKLEAQIDRGAPVLRVLGCRRDGKIEVNIAPDEVTASLTITRAMGGAQPSRVHVEAALASAGVVAGIDSAAIEQAISVGECADFVVARGKPPVDGRDGTLEVLVAVDTTPAFRAQEDLDVVDYRELEKFASVKVGTPLLRRRSGTVGVDGYSVRGRVLPAKSGSDIALPKNLKNVAPDAVDPNLLVATAAGKPVFGPNAVAVEATLTIPRVDLNSGNVYFEGRIVVTGDVIAGMKVRSDSEVIIHGVVEAAEIEAKGDIVIKGGVIGNLEISNVPAPSSASVPPVSAARPTGGSQYRLPAISASTASGSGRPGSIPPPATARSKSIPPTARTSSHPSIPAISARSPSVMIAAIVGRGSATSRSSLMPAVSASAPPPSKGARMPAILRSGGSVVAKFVESAVVDARRRITVAEHVKQSELTALDRVDIGTSPGRGRLVGGIVRASACVQVQVAGTSNEVPTTIEVGAALVSAVLERTRVELEQVETEHGLVVRMITRSRSVVGGMNADDHERRRVELARRMADLAAERDALEGQLRMSTEPEVVVRDRLHAGVTIKIGERTTTVTDERGPVRVRIVEGEIDL